MRRIEVPVLVVGAGPVGMMAGILLGREARRALVVERRAGPQAAPAAHVVNARTFEICRQAGVDMDAIARASKDPADAGHVVFVTRLAGEEVGRLPFEQQGADCLEHTPTPLRNLSQHRFERILADSLAGMPTVDLRYGQQWESAEQNADGVTSLVRDLERDELTEVHSRYLIAADGAGSRVRRSLGIGMQGPPHIQSFLMIHVEADLRRFVADRPGVLHWILDPEAGGALVAHNIDREWVYMHGIDADRESLDNYDEARCRALVWRAIGEDAPLRILHRSTWNMSAQVADRMRDERIFLAGDAAHRFPPTGGLGLNTGIADVHGLVWRLAAVDAGWASQSLLDHYETERLPVARNNAEQSLRNAMKMLQIPLALGVTEEPTTARMQATLRDPEARRRVEATIADQAEHFDMLGLQLGYVYEEGTLVGDGTPATASANPVREYRPSARPGARLPHAWIERNGIRGSTLDLVDPHGLTLLSQGAHDLWAKAIETVAGVPIHHIRANEDFEDPDDRWGSRCELGPTGALLVRPDHHVACREASLPADPRDALARAIAALGLGSAQGLSGRSATARSMHHKAASEPIA